MNTQNLEQLAKLVRYYILTMTTRAGSGHPTSSLSSADLMTVLWFGNYFHYDFSNPDNPNNDRLIFSKGHATPLYYALFAEAGAIEEKELEVYRTFDSRLEGHPTARFPFAEAATGSLGQGLSIGVGEALALRARMTNNQLPINNEKSNLQLPKVFVLLGDGEMAEGSVWEAVNLAAHYKLDNLVAIVDVNRLGQTQETMVGWDTEKYKKRFEAFGWDTIVIDGHDFQSIRNALESSKSKFQNPKPEEIRKPFAIIAKTVKGKGVSFIENKDGWHGKPLPSDMLVKALEELKPLDTTIRGSVEKPLGREIPNFKIPNPKQIPNPKIGTTYKLGDLVATRKAYGTALAKLGDINPEIVVLDAETKNSTYAEDFLKKHPQRYYEMFIAEQNMIGTALGFAKRGFVPFVSTFAAFLSRGFDQIRMAAVSGANVHFCGSHAGVSIGEDGPSQMGLEDIAMFRAIQGSTILYPADAVAAEKLVAQMVGLPGISYVRMSRPTTPVIYDNNEEFPVGGFKVHKSKIQNPNDKSNPKSKVQSSNKRIIIISAGVTLFEALKAQEELVKDNIEVTVIDLYSIKPIDEKKLRDLVYSNGGDRDTTIQIVTVEDHWWDGGLGDAVLNVFAKDNKVQIHKLAVTQMPRSGKPAQLLDYEGISAKGIVEKVKLILQ